MFQSAFHYSKWQFCRSGCIVGILIGLFLMQSPGIAEDSDKLFKQARKKTLEKKWDEAVPLYDQFINQYQGNKDEEEAFFWLAYCLEQKNPNDIEAFLAYDELIQAFPNGTWTDDAVIHQVGITAWFVKSGKEGFRDFLYDKLKDDQPQIRQQTAIALGRIGDKTALPLLREMAENPDQKEIVSPLIKDIESGKQTIEPVVTEPAPQKQGSFEVSATRERLGLTEVKEKRTWDWSKLLPFFYSKRHRQYTSLLKTNEKWTQNELIDFGMWTILPTNEFEAYYQLPDYDRSEWLRKYWKRRDPTPATETNEAFEEFKKRIKYANDNYSETWDCKFFRYKRDMYQRLGWPNAPWDARGELYVKYGPPRFESIHGWHTEEWIYYKYHVDFIVKQYETNIYYDAIQPGALSEDTYGENIEYVNVNYIASHEFRYEHDYRARPLQLKDDRFFTENGILKFEYAIPIKELGYDKSGDAYQFNYEMTIVVFDEDMREVMRQDTEMAFQRENKSAYKKDKYFKHQIELPLQPGPYRIAIQIDDLHSDKMNIFLKELDTSRPPE